MTEMSPLDLAVHITGGMLMTIMIMIMTVAIVILCNTTPQYKQWQDKDPDDLDDTSSTDGTYKPSHLS